VVFAVSCVLVAETFNTALEELCDKFQPTHDPHIAKIKDLSAAAVLLASVGALSIGLIIFIPHLI
jgi:diacylglycerol kinase